LQFHAAVKSLEGTLGIPHIRNSYAIKDDRYPTHRPTKMQSNIKKFEHAVAEKPEFEPKGCHPKMKDVLLHIF
jgi:hypothetical protein